MWTDLLTKPPIRPQGPLQQLEFPWGFAKSAKRTGIIGSILGLIHGLLLGFASGGCAGGWALTAARWYERSMTAWGMTQAVYNYYQGKATWWDALAFLPAAGWGARKIGNLTGIFRACFVGDTLVLVRPMPEGTTQAVATAGAGPGDARGLIAIGAGGFCFVAAAGIVVADVRRRRKSREQQRREAIDDVFGRDDGPRDLDGSQNAWLEPWMDELPDSTTGDLNALCDQLFNSDDCDWRIREGEAPAEPSQPSRSLSDQGVTPRSEQPLWPASHRASSLTTLSPVSDRATSPTAGLPQPANDPVAVLDTRPTPTETKLQEPTMPQVAESRPKAAARRSKRPRRSLRWMWAAMLGLLGIGAFAWGARSPEAPPPPPTLEAHDVAAPPYETRQIRDIRTGPRVMADNPGLADEDVPAEEVTAETHRNVVFRQVDPDGSSVDFELIRSRD